MRRLNPGSSITRNNSKFQTPNSKLQTPNSKLQTSLPHINHLNIRIIRSIKGELLLTYLRICNKLIYFISCLLILVSLSCIEQKTPEVKSDIIRTGSEQDRLKTCSQVNFIKGVLEHRNLLKLFVCTKWSTQYPSLFARIKKVRTQDWNHFFIPLDKHFFSNHGL